MVGYIGPNGAGNRRPEDAHGRPLSVRGAGEGLRPRAGAQRTRLARRIGVVFASAHSSGGDLPLGAVLSGDPSRASLCAVQSLLRAGFPGEQMPRYWRSGSSPRCLSAASRSSQSRRRLLRDAVDRERGSPSASETDRVPSEDEIATLASSSMTRERRPCSAVPAARGRMQS